MNNTLNDKLNFETVTGIKMIIRESDGYINISKLCSDNKLNLQTVLKYKRIQEYIQDLKNYLPDIQDKLIDETDKYRGIYAHPFIAYNIVLTISPKLLMYIMHFIQSSFVTNSWYEYTTENAYIKLNKSNFLTMKESNIISKRKNVYKFPIRKAFYVVSFDKYKSVYKFGITNDINERLRTYRTSNPWLHIKYLLYTDCNANIEESYKSLCTQRGRLSYNSSELVCDEIDNIIHDVIKIANIFDEEYMTCPQSELEKYNNDIENCDIILHGDKLKTVIETPNWDKPLVLKETPHIECDEKGQVLRKKCTSCKVIKPANHFHKQPGRPGNLTSHCIICRNTPIKTVKEITEKQCKQCEKTKPVSEFYTSRRSDDKYEGRCKLCRFPKNTDTKQKNLYPP